jgi:ADP-heptose:LPS heptosyltransferase
MPHTGSDLEFPVRASDRLTAHAMLQARGLTDGRYVCLHPGARDARRRWPASRFAAVADALSGDGFAVVLTGSRDEAQIVRSVRENMRVDAVDLAGATDLGALAAIIESAALLVSNDTGVAHLADALWVPSVIASRNGDRERWAPPDAELHRWVAVQDDEASFTAVLAASRAQLSAGRVHVA